METYNKLKNLYNEFQELKDLPYIEFSGLALDLINQIKIEIQDYYISKPEDSFKKYATLLSNKLNQLLENINTISIDKIKHKLIEYEYNYNFEEYSIESILHLDPESGLYGNLSFPINKLSNDSNSDKIYFLQKDFLTFSKTAIVKDILHFLDSFSNTKDDIINLNTGKHKFHGSQTEFIELIKALIVNRNLKGTQKNIIGDLAEFFDIEIKNQDKLIQDIKNRNNGSEALFLEKLKSSLLDYIKK